MPGEKGLGMTVGKRGSSRSDRCEIMGGRMREFSDGIWKVRFGGKSTIKGKTFVDFRRKLKFSRGEGFESRCVFCILHSEGPSDLHN